MNCIPLSAADVRPAIAANSASYACTWVPIVNPKEALAVAPLSKTKLAPSPTIKVPSVGDKPAISANWASYACTSVPITNPNVVLWAAASASSNNSFPAVVKSNNPACPLPVNCIPLSAADVRPAIAANSASYACTWVPIVNPKEALAVAPLSKTKLAPSPTIKLPSVGVKPAISDKLAWTLNSFPLFDNPGPAAVIEPAPENCETVKAVEPSVGVPLWVNTNPLLALTFPCSTKTNVPPVNSSLESASDALDNVKVVPSKAPTE